MGEVEHPYKATDLKDYQFQKDNYGRFNGVAVIGVNQILLGKWIGPYILPGEEGYSPHQSKAFDWNSSVTYMEAAH